MVRSLVALAAAVAAAVVVAVASPAGTAAADCAAPFDAALVGRTFTTTATNKCNPSSKDAARFATITATSVSYDLSTDKGVGLSSTVLKFGPEWVKPSIEYSAGGKTAKAGPWGAGRPLFVSGLSRLIRELAAMGAACKSNEEVWGVVAFLRVVAFQYQLPSNVCLASG